MEKTIFFRLCGVIVSVHCLRESDARTIQAYLAPALFTNDTPMACGAHVSVNDAGAKVLLGPQVPSRPDLTPSLEFEWVVICLALALRPSVSLHVGCVIFQGQAILFVAPSGSGKSSMTLAAVRAQAEYVTDDVLILSQGNGYGLARAIRFKSIPAQLEARPSYLEGMDLESYIVTHRGQRRIVPLYSGEMRTRHEVDFSQFPPPVVVRVAQGAAPSLTPLSSLDRAIILHEAAITEHEEYDGSLGPGPTFDLVWRDPSESFEMLAAAIRDLNNPAA